MTTPTPRAALKALLAQLANIPPAYCIWKGEPEPNVTTPASSLAIQHVTPGSPGIAQVLSTRALTAGQMVTVSGVQNMQGLGGAFPITIVDAQNVQLTGSSVTGAYLGGGTLALVSPYKHGWMRIGASRRRSVGWDDLRRTPNPDGTFTMQSVGRRQITLGVDFFSLDRGLSGGAFVTMADDVLEDVCTKLWHPSVLDTLNGMGLVFEDQADILPLSYIVNDTELDAAHVDLTVALAVVDAASYTFVNGWVQEVAGTGTAIQENGVGVSLPFDIGSWSGTGPGSYFGDTNVAGPYAVAQQFADAKGNTGPVLGSSS